MTFQLNIMTKLNDDMLQIIEQILPYFQPHYTLTVKFLGNLEEKRDIPIQLDDITMTDDYEGNFDQRRALIYTLTFTAKTFLFGPVEDVTGSIIKKVTVGYLADTTLGAERDITYTVTPRARQGLRWRRNNLCLRQHRSHHTDHSRWRFFRSRGWYLHLC